MSESQVVKRGQIWYVKYNDAVGYEEAVGRPGLIVSEPTEDNPLITLVWLTTTPKSGGTVVEMSVPRKRSWAMCHHIVTIDKTRLLQGMCTVTDEELLKVEVALRKVLLLPVKNTAETDKMLDKIAQLEDRIAELEIDNIVHKRLCDKAVDKIVEMKMDRGTTVAKVVEEPKVVETQPVLPEEPLDLTRLAEKFKVYDEKLKTKEELKAKKEELKAKKEELKAMKDKREKVNVNTASATEIMEKTGLSSNIAYSISANRRKYGPYEKLEDLLVCSRFTEYHIKKYGHLLEV